MNHIAQSMKSIFTQERVDQCVGATKIAVVVGLVAFATFTILSGVFAGVLAGVLIAAVSFVAVACVPDERKEMSAEMQNIKH